MAQPEEARDPSMEEILASIRRIIAEDTGDPPARPSHLAVVPDPEEEPPSASSRRAASRLRARAAANAAPPEAEEEAPPEQPEDLLPAEEMDEPEASYEDAAELEPWAEPDDLEDDDPVATAAAETMDDEAPVADEAGVPEPDLEAIAAAMIGQDRARSVNAGGGRLLSPQADRAVHTAFNQLASTILSDQARTLEDLVKDMMRPMLKNWLDDNLPTLVERLVREEIERVSRGRR